LQKHVQGEKKRGATKGGKGDYFTRTVKIWVTFVVKGGKTTGNQGGGYLGKTGLRTGTKNQATKVGQQVTLVKKDRRVMGKGINKWLAQRKTTKKSHLTLGEGHTY